MPGLSTFDPAKFKIIIGGIEIEGFAEDTFFNFEREVDTFNKTTGSDGRTTRVKTNNRSGTATLTLQQSSPSNDFLSAIMQLDETSNDGIVAILVKDLLGTTTVASAYGWVRKPPPLPRGSTVQNTEWLIDIADSDVFVGGNPTFQG